MVCSGKSQEANGEPSQQRLRLLGDIGCWNLRRTFVGLGLLEAFGTGRTPPSNTQFGNCALNGNSDQDGARTTRDKNTYFLICVTWRSITVTSKSSHCLHIRLNSFVGYVMSNFWGPTAPAKNQLFSKIENRQRRYTHLAWAQLQVQCRTSSCRLFGNQAPSSPPLESY